MLKIVLLYASKNFVVQQVGLEPTHTTVSEWLTDTNRLLPLDKVDV